MAGGCFASDAELKSLVQTGVDLTVGRLVVEFLMTTMEVIAMDGRYGPEAYDYAGADCSVVRGC